MTASSPLDVGGASRTAPISTAGESRIPCRYYSAGFCAAGEKCVFRHVSPDQLEKCRFYAAGTCKFGQSCSRSHALSSPPVVETTGTADALPLVLLKDLRLGEESGPLSSSETTDKNDPSQEYQKQGEKMDDGLSDGPMRPPSVKFGTLSFAELARRGIPEGPAPSLRPGATPGPSSAPTAQNGKASPTSSPMTVLASTLTKSNDLCPFAMVGKCRYGSLCRNVHGISCPRCLRYCLYPNDLEKNEEHIEECLGRQDIPSPADVKEIECGICLGRVAEKDDPRFGLLNCDHAFCLKCIRTWRAQHTMHDLATKSCPLCRVVTYFIIPSSTWTIDPAEKGRIVAAYKQRCSTIHCKYFSSGDGVCPFGSSCFYAHRTRDGRPDQPALRSYINAEEKVQILREPRLCDFIDFQLRHGATDRSGTDK